MGAHMNKGYRAEGWVGARVGRGGGGCVPSDKNFLRVPSDNIFCALKTFVVLLEKFCILVIEHGGT